MRSIDPQPTGSLRRAALVTLTGHREALDAAEPDAEELALMRDVLRLAWRRHGLNDPTAEVDDELRARVDGMERRGDGTAGA